MAERGMGRGLAAILQVLGAARRPAGAARHLDRARRARTRAAAPALRRGRARRARRVDRPRAACSSRSSCARATGGRYELVAGERRWRAAQLAGLAVLPAIVERRDDAASLEVALVENMAREDLNPIEEARAVAALVEELGLTREEVGRRVGRSRVAVSNLIRLLDLPDEVLELLESGRAHRGPRPRAAAAPRTTAHRRRLAHERRRRRLVGPRPRGPRAQGERGPRVARPADGRPCIPTRSRGLRGDRRDALGGARPRGHSVAPAGRPAVKVAARGVEGRATRRFGGARSRARRRPTGARLHRVAEISRSARAISSVG